MAEGVTKAKSPLASLYPSAPLGIGRRYVDNQAGWHAEFKAGAIIRINRIFQVDMDNWIGDEYGLAFQPLMGVRANLLYEERFAVGSVGITAYWFRVQNEILWGIENEILHNPYTANHYGWRIGFSAQFESDFSIELSYQKYDYSEIQLLLGFDPLLFFRKTDLTDIYR
jgi:hypothetical protein